MSTDKPPTRLFSQIYDDVLRRPDLTSHDVRLYGVMLSYCPKTKTDTPRVCRLTKIALAGILRIAERTVYDSLRNLQKAGLISISYSEVDRRLPVYTFNEDPPIVCPDLLMTNRRNDAIDYVRNAGGVKGLQRRVFKVRKAGKRTGRPKGQAGNIKTPTDPPAEPETSPPASFAGSVLPEDSPPPPQVMAVHCRVGGSVLPRPTDLVAEHCRVGGSVLPGVVAVHCQLGSSTLPPGTEVIREKGLEIPNGMDPLGDYRRLGERARAPALAPAANQAVNHKPQVQAVRRSDITLLASHDSDIKNEPEVAAMARPTDEEMAAERARRKALAPGTRQGLSDVSKTVNQSKGTDAPQKRQRGAGPPPDGKMSTQEVLNKHLTKDPDTVTEVPSSPWGLYTHFSRVVRKKFPDARLPSASNGKYLKWGKTMLSNYSTTDLYEMIQVLVLDYENISVSRIFFKFSGTPTPTYEQLFSNGDMLITFIGRGIIAPPSVRFSKYAEDYNRRHGKSAAGPLSDINPSGKSAIDPIEALRDRINGPKAK